MSPSYGMITEPLSELSLGTRHLSHPRSLLKCTYLIEVDVQNSRRPPVVNSAFGVYDC